MLHLWLETHFQDQGNFVLSRNIQAGVFSKTLSDDEPRFN